MASLKEDLVACAESIGIDLIGITTAEPFERYLSELEQRAPHYKERWDYRIEGWKKMARPRDMLPGARSVIVIGYYYLTDEPKRPGSNGVLGRVVTYGHLGILKRALRTKDFLEKRGHQAVIGAHRKEAAVRAGLGQIGKNGLVLNPTYGSWVAYQSIITDAALESDEPFTEDLCGDCDDCLRACPTQALYEPRRVDPRKCVTYMLTMPEIPEETWPRCGTCVLGCDACLESCPRNRDLRPKEDVESLLGPELGTQPPLKLLLNLTEEAFLKEIIGPMAAKFSAGEKTGKDMRNQFQGKETLPETFMYASDNLDVYKRNALIAAGNLGDPEMLPEILKFSDDSYLGKYARWAAARLQA